MDRVLALGFAEASKIFTRFDADRAFAVARAVDRRKRAGEDLPLHGLRVSIKDLFDEAGVVTTAGSTLMRDRPPATADAVAVARLLAGGAVPFGRTTMSEFAYSGVGLNPHHGTPGNVRDRSRIPGGSTSGGGVSVGLGLCDAALGSDTGGSIRIPAALNGLAGFKPSQGSVPLAGGFPLSGTYDSFGPIAPTVAVCAAIHAVLCGEARPAARRRSVAGLRVGVVSTVMADGLDDAVGDHYGRALAELSRAGAVLHDIASPVLRRGRHQRHHRVGRGPCDPRAPSRSARGRSATRGCCGASAPGRPWRPRRWPRLAAAAMPRGPPMRRWPARSTCWSPPPCPS